MAHAMSKQKQILCDKNQMTIDQVQPRHTTRDVNFGFSQKSIIVLKKSIFFDYRIWVSLSRHVAITQRAACLLQYRRYVVTLYLHSQYKTVSGAVDIATSAGLPAVGLLASCLLVNFTASK